MPAHPGDDFNRGRLPLQSGGKKQAHRLGVATMRLITQYK